MDKRRTAALPTDQLHLGHGKWAKHDVLQPNVLQNGTGRRIRSTHERIVNETSKWFFKSRRGFMKFNSFCGFEIFECFYKASGSFLVTKFASNSTWNRNPASKKLSSTRFGQIQGIS